MNTERIDAFLQDEGISKEQLVLEWIKKGLIDINSLKKKSEFAAINAHTRVKPGMFYQSNGCISEEYVGDDCVAMIISVNQKAKTAIALVLKGATLPFSSDGFVIKTECLSGQEATKLICEQAKQCGKHAEAAEYCRDFSCPGIQKGMAFLPSEQEVKAMTAYMFNIRAAGISCGTPIRCLITSSCNEEMVKVYQLGGADLSMEMADFPMQVHPAVEIHLS